MKYYLFVTLSFLTLNVAFATDNYPKNPDIDIVHYAFSLTLSDDTDVINGTAEVHFISKKDGLQSLRLDLINISESQGKGMKVESITFQDGKLTFKHEKDELWITLPAQLATGKTNVLTIQYSGIPGTGLIIGPNKYNDRTFFSDNWPNKARNWLPVVDHPYDKATCEFIITAPARYQVISNGLKMEESNISDKVKLTHWKQSVPISSWLYVLGVAEFAVQYVDEFEGKSIQTWVYKQDRDKGFYDFAVPTGDALQFYSDYVGPFAYEKLANVQSNSVKGGMEAATAILYGDNSVTGERTERWQHVIIHEVAHQWFGNAVTEYDWDDVWLSEGFATYFTTLFIEYAYGKEKFVEVLQKSRQQVYEFYKNNKDYRIVHNNLKDMSKVTTIQTYQKGGWVLHMLRQEIGDDAFQRGFQAYYRKYMNRNATTADFIKEIEQASGRDLQTFFQQWLYQGGNIELKGTWNYDEKRKKIRINLEQLQKNYTFNFPLEIGISSGNSGTRIESIVVDKQTAYFEVDANVKPEHVELDPYTKLLATWDFHQR